MYNINLSETKFGQRMRRQRRKLLINKIIIIIVLLTIVYVLSSFRLDFAGGSHKIFPTAVDTNVFGNYIVYYRSTEFTKDAEDSIYYIHKDNINVAEDVREVIRQGKFAIVYYDKYIGFKGITAPRSSPITRIEILE